MTADTSTISNRVGLDITRVYDVAVITSNPEYFDVLINLASKTHSYDPFRCIQSVDMLYEDKTFLAVKCGFGSAEFHRIVSELHAFGVNKMILLTETWDMAESQCDAHIIYSAIREENTAEEETFIGFPAVAHPDIVTLLKNTAKVVGIKTLYNMSHTSSMLSYHGKKIYEPPSKISAAKMVPLKDFESAAFLVFTASRAIKAGVISPSSRGEMYYNIQDYKDAVKNESGHIFQTIVVAAKAAAQLSSC